MSDRLLLDAIDLVANRLIAGPLAAPVFENAATAEAAKLLQAAGWIETRGGAYVVSGKRGLVIGLDLGGTKLRGAIGNAAGQILVEYDLPTVTDAPDHVIAQMADMACSLAARAGVPMDAVERVTIGVPGVVAPDGRVVLSPNVSFDGNTPLAAALENMLGAQVSVDNDGNLSAYGELVAGCGSDRQARSLAFLAIGTGIGMGLIVDGHLLHGKSGGAGEIAFIPFGGDPFSDAAANPGGTFEAAVGTDGIRRAYARATGEDIDVREIFDRADAGDASAAAVIDDTTRSIALGVATVIALLDPGIVVVGGGIGARPGLAEKIGALTARLVPTACEVVPSALGDRAGVIGALAFACHEARLSLIERAGIDDKKGAAA